MDRIGRGRVIKVTVAAGVVAVVGLFFGPTAVTNRAHGLTGCSQASLSGTYGIEGFGSIGGVPAAFVGSLGFDGQGNSTAGSLVLTLGGTIDRIASTATYKVDPSCNGTMLIKTAHSNPPRTHYHNIDIAVVDGGKEVYFMVGGPINSPSETPPPGEVLSGFLKRQ